jgi:hypothetical protein
MALPLLGRRPTGVVPSLPPDRSVVETLRIVELVAWSFLSVAVAALLAAAVGGAVVVSSRPLTAPAAALLVAAVAGTLVAVVADVAFE